MPISVLDDVTALTGTTHRQLHARLVEEGWNVCGIGDWAITFRSPDGTRAARVCPFDPAYPVFVDLCRRLPGHSYLPRIDADVALDGGGQLTVMEFLTSADADTVAKVKQDWDSHAGDLQVIRAEAERLNAAAADAVAWWDGIDLNAGNIMTSLSGRPKLVDVFCVDGEDMYRTLLTDPVTLAAKLPAKSRRHMTDIAYIARTSTPTEIAALRDAAVAAG